MGERLVFSVLRLCSRGDWFKEDRELSLREASEGTLHCQSCKVSRVTATPFHLPPESIGYAVVCVSLHCGFSGDDISSGEKAELQ
jgi:hypothetical protein